jgi:AraC family transcriptional regulator
MEPLAYAGASSGGKSSENEMTVETRLQPARFEQGKALLLAGLRGRFAAGTVKDIPALWERFAPDIRKITGQIGRTTYGAVFHNCGDQGGFDYMSAVAVSGFAGLPAGWSRVSVPAQKYAVFSHAEHVSMLSKTVGSIFHTWLPASGYEAAGQAADAPHFLERYGEHFDPQSGTGDVEIWIPIKA